MQHCNLFLRIMLLIVIQHKIQAFPPNFLVRKFSLNDESPENLQKLSAENVPIRKLGDTACILCSQTNLESNIA